MLPRRSSRAAYRERLWKAEAAKAREAGKGEFPICNLCGRAVLPARQWDESHDPSLPRAWGGTATGVAHRKCNRLHGARVVVPQLAKTNRQWRANVGITGPGVSANPLPGGRNDRIKKKLNGRVELR